MFQNPFSFKGRIRRLEYGLSLIVSFMILIIISIISAESEHASFTLTFTFIAYFWFNLSQGSKRCHDFNQSGILQFVPFCVFLLLFSSGTSGQNQYGIDPKATQNTSQISGFNLKELLNKLTLIILNPLITSMLFNIAIIIILFEFVSFNQVYLNLSIYSSVIISYFLFLTTIKNQPAFYNNQQLKLIYRSIYAVFLHLFMSIYLIVFLSYEVNFYSVLFQLTIIFILVSLTFISELLASKLIKNKK